MFQKITDGKFFHFQVLRGKRPFLHDGKLIAMCEVVWIYGNFLGVSSDVISFDNNDGLTIEEEVDDEKEDEEEDEDE